MSIHEQPSDLAVVVAALEARLETQERTLAGLRTKLEAAHTTRRTTRLRTLVPLVGLLCLMVLSLTLLPAARAQNPTPQAAPDFSEAAREDQARQSQPAPAAGVPAEKQVASPSATGGNLIIGQTNFPSAVADFTGLINPSPSALMPSALRVDNYSDASLILSGGILDNRRVAIVGSTSGIANSGGIRIGMLGAADSGYGVYGYTPGGAAAAVRGDAPEVNSGWGVWGTGGRVGGVFSGAYGGTFSGTIAPIYLQPSSTAGPPTTGEHFLGELVVSSDGHLWFCRQSGTPGTWVRLDLSSTFVPVVQK